MPVSSIRSSLIEKARSRAGRGYRRLSIAVVTALGAIVLLGAAPPEEDQGASAPLCASGEGKESEFQTKPTLVLSTSAGTITIELYEAAAPKAVRQLAKIVKGPYFDPVVFAAESREAGRGFYDGLTFNYAQPHIEIISESREPIDQFVFETEIDAERLGLDKQLIENPAEAMNVMQRELLVEFGEKKKRGQITELLEGWLDQWYEGYRADFLVGVSRREINEALGYVYQSGLDSRPATRGSVALKPLSPTRATARLSILLADIPERTGRVMVIGDVMEGLEVAEAISTKPRKMPPSAHRKQFLPENPIAIETMELVCRFAASKPLPYSDLPQMDP